MKVSAGLLAVLAALGSTMASASVVTSLPGGSVVPMPAVNASGAGPEVFDGITWTSTNASNQGGSVFGYTGTYGFIGNGSWDGALGPMAGLNDSFAFFDVTDSMTFALSSPVAGIGGFLNYLPGGSTPTTIAVYDSSHTLIESDTLTFTTAGGTDEGQFLGFLEGTPDISYFTLTDNYIGITDLTITGQTAVPEPNSALLLTGAVGLIGLLRRKLFR